MNTLQNFSKGLVKENPVLVLVLGTCPTLATSTSVTNALGMGAAATVVLLCSNIVISALRKIIPDKVRIPCYIVLIAGFVTAVQMLVKAFAPALDASLGIYLPLIVVNCIILGRAEMFANKNKVWDSAVDGLGMGAGFYPGARAYGNYPRGIRQRYIYGNTDPGTQRQPYFYPDNGSRRILCIRTADRGGQQVLRQQAKEKGLRLRGLSVGSDLRQSRLRLR